jgi:hypothetical protein
MEPIMEEVFTNAQGGLDEENTQKVLDDLDLYAGALNKCNVVIENYNESIKTNESVKINY